MVYVLLGNGFEEIEAITPIDFLRRCGVEVKTVGVNGYEIMGAHGIPVRADCSVEQIDREALEMLIIPGGLGGVESISTNVNAMVAIASAYHDGKYIAAICAGPTILAKLELIEGKSLTSYPGTQSQLGNVNYSEELVVTDGKLITSRGPATSLLFAQKLGEILCGKEKSDEVARGMLLI